jgi:hypothetical protein
MPRDRKKADWLGARSMHLLTAVRLKVEQIQLVSGVGHVGLGRIGLQGA